MAALFERPWTVLNEMETETVRRRRFVSLFPRWDEAIGVFGVVHVSLGVGGDRCCSSLGRWQRQGLPGRELDRIRRQQQFLRSLVGERRGEVDLTDPLGIVRVLDTITRAVGVYDRMSNSDRRDLFPAFGEDPALSWDNPPHRSHLCHGCGLSTPSSVPTNTQKGPPWLSSKAPRQKRT